MKKFSLSYAIFRVYLSIPFHIFYRRVIVDGKENIPNDQPVIFAPNHQNALMDPFAIIYTTKKQNLFISRGDLFTNTKVVKIFTWLKMLPSYRDRDGKNNLHKNEVVFKKSADAVNRGIPLCLFPEANHNEYRSLLPLRKMIPRIAFLASEESAYTSNIHIIPVGIYYSDRVNSRSILHVKYGKAILIKDYVELYKENPQKAMNVLRNDMVPHIKSLIINIEDREYNSLYENLRKFYADRLLRLKKLKSNQRNKFLVDREIIEKIGSVKNDNEELFIKLNEKVSSFSYSLKSKKLPLNFFSNKKSVIIKSLILIALLVFSPFFIAGYLINVLPLSIPGYIRKNVIKHPQFISSIKFVTGALIIPIFYLIVGILISIIANLNLIYVFGTIGLLGYLSFMYSKLFKQFNNWLVKPIRARKSLKNLEKQYLEITSILDPIFINNKSIS